jgi:DNA polymerase I-like protein with 3'-5' exonuclease and polymerase domains
VYRKASSGDAISIEAEMLTNQLEQLERDIHAQNNNQEFNIQSVKQVSQVLFGEPSHPTNKETLEAMGGAGHMRADLILQYRSLR